jgi:hypothetical protein
MKRIERFDNYMVAKGLNDNRVTKEVGLSVGTLGKSRKENRDLSDKVVEQLLNFYKDLSRDWLLKGEGEMLKKSSYSQNVSPTVLADDHSTAIAGNKNVVNADQTIAMLVAEVAAQRRLTERVLEQNSELLAIVAGKKNI